MRSTLLCTSFVACACGVCSLDEDERALAGFETHADDTTPFHGLNKWPGAEQCPGFRETMEAYYAAMHAVALRCALVQRKSMPETLVTRGQLTSCA